MKGSSSAETKLSVLCADTARYSAGAAKVFCAPEEGERVRNVQMPAGTSECTLLLASVTSREPDLVRFGSLASDRSMLARGPRTLPLTGEAYEVLRGMRGPAVGD